MVHWELRFLLLPGVTLLQNRLLYNVCNFGYHQFLVENFQHGIDKTPLGVNFKYSTVLDWPLTVLYGKLLIRYICKGCLVRNSKFYWYSFNWLIQTTIPIVRDLFSILVPNDSLKLILKPVVWIYTTLTWLWFTFTG